MGADPPYESLVDDVHDDRLCNVWKTNPGVRSHAAALESLDEELKAFARSLDPSFEIVDLKERRIGSGFSWGRYGPETIVRRYGKVPMFAYQRPPKPRGLFARLFS